MALAREACPVHARQIPLREASNGMLICICERLRGVLQKAAEQARAEERERAARTAEKHYRRRVEVRMDTFGLEGDPDALAAIAGERDAETRGAQAAAEEIAAAIRRGAE